MGSDLRAAPDQQSSAARVPVPPAPPDGTAPTRAAHLPAAASAALAAVARRVRVQRALDAGCAFAIAALGIAALGVCLVKTGQTDAARAALMCALLMPWLGGAIGALRPLPVLLSARLLDRAARTPDLIASAWAFAQLPDAQRTAFMNACVARAGEQASRTSAALALPLRAPRGWRPVLLLAAALLALLALDLQRPAPVVARTVSKPRLLHEEDLSAVHQELTSLRELAAEDPALRSAIEELNSLLEALHDGELDRLEALRELRALQERLRIDALSQDDAALREALKAVGKALGQDSLAKELADALAEADAAKARAEAERLAQQLAEHPPSKPAAQQLQRALERAAKPKPGSEQDARMKRLQDEVDRLLKKQREGQALSENEQRLLQKKQRELEQLQREQQQRAQAERQLEQLQRELGNSGGALGQNQQQRASQHMQQGARELERMAKQQLTAEQREKLQRTLQQLRELVSKQQGQQGEQGQGGQGKQGQGQGQVQRLDLGRFGKLARGQGSEGKDGQGKDGQRKDGKDGQGQQGAALIPGQGGEPAGAIEMDGDGEGDGPQRLQLKEALVPGGTAAGQGGRPQRLRTATELESERVDTRVQGELGEGPSRSQVIREAGQRGFASRGYEQVHGDYSRHAEAVLEHDQVPGGYRFYVRRYFQLIRPRQETHD